MFSFFHVVFDPQLGIHSIHFFVIIRYFNGPGRSLGIKLFQYIRLYFRFLMQYWIVAVRKNIVLLHLLCVYHLKQRIRSCKYTCDPSFCHVSLIIFFIIHCVCMIFPYLHRDYKNETYVSYLLSALNSFSIHFAADNRVQLCILGEDLFPMLLPLWNKTSTLVKVCLCLLGFIHPPGNECMDSSINRV